MPTSLSTVRYHTRSRAPQLEIHLEGNVSGNEVRRKFADLPDALASLPRRFFAMIDYGEVILFEADALGPLFYYVTHLYDANPEFCVFVDGDQTPHPGLRAFVEQVGLENQTVFVPSRSEGHERIRAYTRRRTES